MIKIKINKIKFKLFNVFNNSSIDDDKEVVNGGVVIRGVVAIEDAVVIDDVVAIDDAVVIEGIVILTLLNFSENTWDLPIILDYLLCIYRFLPSFL